MIEYEKFQSNFKKTEVSGEEVGELIMRMAGYFARYNVRLSNALRAYTIVCQGVYNMAGDAGKPITASKAEIVAEATPEAAAYELARIHVQNIEQYINSLKSLQKGVLQEYAHSA